MIGKQNISLSTDMNRLKQQRKAIRRQLWQKLMISNMLRHAGNPDKVTNKE